MEHAGSEQKKRRLCNWSWTGETYLVRYRAVGSKTILEASDWAAPSAYRAIQVWARCWLQLPASVREREEGDWHWAAEPVRSEVLWAGPCAGRVGAERPVQEERSGAKYAGLPLLWVAE